MADEIESGGIEVAVGKPASWSELEALMARRIVLLDGAMGTNIQQFKPGEADFRGDRFRDHGRD